MQNIEMLCNAQSKIIRLFDDSSTVVCEVKYKTIHGEGIKMLTPKQMFQRLQ